MLSPLVISQPLAFDIYTPALPGIAHQFKVSAGIMQLTLSIFLFSSSIMQLVYGPLTDKYGRKPVGILAAFIYGLGCILCAGAASITMLMIARLIQSLGACGMMVIGMAVVRDCYKGEKSAKAYSYINGMIAFSPMIAPFIGSYLDLEFGWPATFIALVCIAVSAIAFLTLLPETHLEINKTINIKNISTTYVSITKNKQFLIYSISGAFCVCYLFLFCSLSPYLILHQLKIPEKDYGFYFCFMGIATLIGSSIGSQLATRIGIYKSTLTGAVISLMGGTWMTSWFLFHGLQIMGWVLPMLLIGSGGAITVGSASGGAMATQDKNAGAAASLNGAYRFLIPATLASIVITGNVKTPLPLAIPAILFSSLILIVFLFYRQKLDFRYIETK